MFSSQSTQLQELAVDDHLPLAQRRSRRANRGLPLRFRDMLPEPPLPLPPPEILEGPARMTQVLVVNTPSAPSADTVLSVQPDRSLLCSLRKFLKTHTNKFGLFRVYYTDSVPRHDPEDPYSVENTYLPREHSDSLPDDPSDLLSTNPFYPYPNESAMRLGDWYWNQGAQKSRDSFKELLNIMGDPAFSSSAISQTRWHTINEKLGRNHFDGDLPQWLGQDDGWKCSPVTISVPFHSRAKNPGCKSYTVQGFYHRSLISILREKITDPTHAAFFHYEPYEPRWHPPHRNDDVKVHGELFNSAAFLEAHQQLQDSPPEPGCDLPRVVAALMFWSDSTQLTQFGTAKLWPLYVFFGNESKYRRCQSTNNTCSHAAYFQVVCECFL